EAVLSLGSPADSSLLEGARAVAEEMASRALRVLVCGEVRGGHLGVTEGFEHLKGSVRILGLVGQMDPPRDEAHAAVADCLAAGIRPIMITGDHQATGRAIGRMIGI